MDVGAALRKAVWESQVTSYVWVSGLVVLTYDTISTLPREVTYIWRAKWSLPKVLYLSLRYLGLVQAIMYAATYSTVQTSVKVLWCRAFYWFAMTIGSNIPLILFVNGILGIRLYALYSRNIKVLCFLSLIFLGEFGVQMYIIAKVGPSTVDTAFVPPSGVPILGCLTDPDLSPTKLAWAAGITVAVVCFLMTVAKFFEAALEAWRAGWRIRLSPLASAFIRDGTVYFLAILVTLTGGAVNSSLVPGPFVVLYEPWMAVSLVVAGSRLVLNLREAAFNDFSLHSESVFNSALRGLETSPAHV